MMQTVFHGYQNPDPTTSFDVDESILKAMEFMETKENLLVTLREFTISSNLKKSKSDVCHPFGSTIKLDLAKATLVLLDLDLWTNYTARFRHVCLLANMLVKSSIYTLITSQVQWEKS